MREWPSRARSQPFQEFLGKYRQHEANLFQMNADRVSREQLERRMAAREALFGEIKNWLQEHDKNLDFLEIRSYLKQWERAQESDGSGLRAAGVWPEPRFNLSCRQPDLFAERLRALGRTWNLPAQPFALRVCGE
jgi:hypothetical protein